MSSVDFQLAATLALKEWSSPNSLFTSGFDKRSSQNEILVQLYGGLVHARKNNWLNAGRRLIDKTYVQILLVTQQLADTPFINAEITAAALDSFIINDMAPQWSSITGNDTEQKHALTLTLIEQAGKTLFGSLQSETIASQLLFNLCPELPVFPMSSSLMQLLFGSEVTQSDIGVYSNYSQYCSKLLSQYRNDLKSIPLAEAQFGSAEEIKLINNLLTHSDWWQRWVLIKALNLRSI